MDYTCDNLNDRFGIADGFGEKFNELRDCMRTTNENNILKLSDGTPICKYCGHKVYVTKDSYTYNHGRDEHETKWYECSCEEWNDTLALEKEILEMNENIQKEYSAYRMKFTDMVREYKKKYKHANDEIFYKELNHLKKLK